MDEKVEKDLEFLRTAVLLAEGVKPLAKRVRKARAMVLRADNARLDAIVSDAPQQVRQARAAAKSHAMLVLREREEYYHEAVKANAAYLRKEALKWTP